MTSWLLPLIFGTLLLLPLLAVLLVGKPSTGKILSASILGFLIGIFGTAFLRNAATFTERQRFETSFATRTPGDSSGAGHTNEKRFEQLNFVIAGLDPQWVEMNAKILNRDTTFLARNALKNLTLSVVVESTGQLLTSEIITEVARSNAASGAELIEWDMLDPMGLGGVESLCAYYETNRDGARTRTLNVHHFSKGYARQFALSTTADISLEKLKSEMVGLIDSFKLIDPDRWGAGADPLHPGQRFPEWSFEMLAGGDRWSKAAKADEVKGQVWHGSFLAVGHLLVVPVALPDVEIDDQALLRGLLSGSTDRGIPTNGVSRKKVEMPGADAWEYSYQEHVSTVGEYLRMIRIIRRGSMAWLIDGGIPADQDEKIPLLKEAIDGFRLLPEGPPGKTPADFFPSFCNQAGLSYYIRGLYSQSRALFEIASREEPEQVTYFANVLDALMSEDKPSEALTQIDEAHSRFSQTTEWKSRRASALAALGRVDEAGEEFFELFNGGFRDDATLQEAAAFLMKNGLEGDALDLVANYRTDGTNQQLDLIHVRLLFEEGDKEEALAMMEKIHLAAPGNQDILIEFADMLRQSGRKEEALEMIRSSVGEKSEDIRMLYQLGFHLADSEKYEEAVEVLEQAASLAPKDQTIQNELAYVRARLGRGHDHEVRVPLEPVPLPPSLTAEPDWDAASVPEDADRYQLRQVTVHEFKPGTPKKQTAYHDVALLSSRAVEAFSTLKFSYKPLAERVYVNRLEVLDAKGKVIAQGDEKSQYVTSLDHEDATGGKMLCVPVPGLAAGCRIRYEVTYQDRSSSSSFPFEGVFFASRYGSKQMTVCVKAAQEDFVVHSTGEVIYEKEGDWHLWTVRDISPTPAESYLPKLELIAPVLYLGPAGKDWISLGDQYLADISKQLVVDPDVESLARDITAGAKEDRDKVRLIFRWIQREFTYKAIEFGMRGRTPNAAGVTCMNRYGDCKDLSVVLHTMLRAVGVPSRLCLVHTSDELHPQVPSLDQFNHMIVYLPGSEGLEAAWLDPTEKNHADIMNAGVWLEGRSTFVLEDGKSRLETMQGPHPESSDQIEFSRVLMPSDHGALAIHETVKFKGAAADGFRGYFLSIPAAERNQKFGELMAGVDSRLKLERVEIRNLQDQDLPFEMGITARVEDATGADGRIKRLPVIWERDYLRTTPQDHRTTPFTIRQRWRVSGETTGSVPLLEQPAADHSGSHEEWGSWGIRFTRQDDLWTLAYSADLKRLPIGKAQDYSRYCGFWDDGLTRLAEPWRARK